MTRHSPLRIRLSRILVVFGLCALASCGGVGKEEASYNLELSPSQAIGFKSDLKKFADENGYLFIDGSQETKEAREYFNRETAKTASGNIGLAAGNGEIIDVTVEPKERTEFLIFAKTDANDAKKVSLTLIYDKTSVAEKRLAAHFLRSQFLRNWRQRAGG